MPEEARSLVKHLHWHDGCSKAVMIEDPPRSKFEAWTIPFHVVMWTTLLVGLVMVMAVVLMH